MDALNKLQQALCIEQLSFFTGPSPVLWKTIGATFPEWLITA
jgi:hypothetical protein